MLAKQRGARRLHTDEIDQRMTDEFNGNAFAPVERSSKGKITSTRSTYRFIVCHAARPPRPQLRADVVDDRNAEAMQRGHQAGS